MNPKGLWHQYIRINGLQQPSAFSTQRSAQETLLSRNLPECRRHRAADRSVRATQAHHTGPRPLTSRVTGWIEKMGHSAEVNIPWTMRGFGKIGGRRGLDRVFDGSHPCAKNAQGWGTRGFSLGREGGPPGRRGQECPRHIIAGEDSGVYKQNAGPSTRPRRASAARDDNLRGRRLTSVTSHGCVIFSGFTS